MERKEKKKYFEDMKKNVEEIYNIANNAKKKEIDPDNKIEIPLAENMIERAIGLVSIVSPQIINSNLSARIVELEKKYGFLDWRISLIIAEEIAKEKNLVMIVMIQQKKK